jgi:hypothetical protein
MNYNKPIPDIYEINDIYKLNKTEKNIMKTYILKSNQKLYISEIFDSLSVNIIYVETDSTQLYLNESNYNMNNIYTKLYNKMIKKLFCVNYILNKSNDDAHITIYKIINNYLSNSYLVSRIFYNPFTSFSHFNPPSTINFLHITTDFIITYYIYDNIYIETTEELNTDNVKIFTKDINFYYYAFRIAKNTYELRIKKIFNKINNKEACFNTNITLNNLDEHYKIMRKNIIEVCEYNKYTTYVDLLGLSKIYHIKLYNGVSTLFSYSLK